MSAAQKIKEKAHELGFELAGIAPAFPVPDFDFFRWWLDRGYAASMSYLQRGAERRGDPSKILPGVRSVVCCGLNYFAEAPGDLVARYAQGKDYHEVVLEKLRTLEDFMRNGIEGGAQTKSYVDTGAILERSYAARAGLGWIGKNTMLINNGVGSFFFIGEILTTLAFDEAEYDRPGIDQCGTCTKCLDACPTGALIEPGVLDANTCVSYLTIEHRGDFTEEQSKRVGGHFYGCDVCQDVCPYNDRIPVTPLPEFRPRPEFKSRLETAAWEMTESGFLKMIEESAMDRISFAQWSRNLRAAGSRGKP